MSEKDSQGQPACLPFLVLYKDRLLLTRLESIFVRKKKHLFSTPVPPLLGHPGSRRCPGSFLQYYRCSGSLALPLRARRREPVGGAGGPSPALVCLAHGLCLALSGAGRAVQALQLYLGNPSWPGSSCGEHRAALLFQALSCRGRGSLCALARALQHRRRVFSLFSILSCCCSSLCTAEAKWPPCS